MSKRKLRVMWQSNAEWAPSGYGMQTADLKKKFLESGWDGSNFALINMFGQSGGIIKDADGVLNFPSIDHVTGSDAMLQHPPRFKADIIIALQDVWTLNPQDLSQIPNFIPFLPIDYDPIPGMILNNIRFANRIIAMSKFGEKSLKESGFASTYIPHHVNTKIFFPLSKKKRKEEIKVDPNMFIFGMISANKDLLPRKSFGHVLRAFKKFHDLHPNSILYIHTNPDFPNGYPLRNHINFLGLQDFVGFPDKYKLNFDTPKPEMNMIYGSMDCLLSPSSTEGFCIPVIEAQATGTPVIVNDYTSMPELIQDGVTGYKTKVSDDCQHFMPIGGYMKFPNVEDLYNKMELVYKANRPEMGIKARKWIEDNYSLEKVWDKKWLKFLDGIEKEIYPETPLTPPVK